MKRFASLVLLGLLAIPALTLAQEVKKDPPAIDKSGEPVMKQILATFGQSNSARLLLERSTKNNALEVGWEKDGMIEFHFRRPGQWRMEYQELFSDGVLLVSDGKTLLVDNLEWTGLVVLRKAPEALAGLTNEASPPRSGSILFAFFDGPDAYAKIVNPEQPITFKTGGLYDELEFVSRNAGRVRLNLRNNQIRQVVYLNRTPQGGQALEEIVSLDLRAVLIDRLFETKPHPALRIRDDR